MVNGMGNIPELERALKDLPMDKKWEVAQSLLQELHDASLNLSEAEQRTVAQLPDYEQRRRAIFGDQIVANMVMEAREEERW
jgi:hypothetical protein